MSQYEDLWNRAFDRVNKMSATDGLFAARCQGLAVAREVYEEALAALQHQLDTALFAFEAGSIGEDLFKRLAKEVEE